jgi:hypothetical protein
VVIVGASALGLNTRNQRPRTPDTTDTAAEPEFGMVKLPFTSAYATVEPIATRAYCRGSCTSVAQSAAFLPGVMIPLTLPFTSTCEIRLSPYTSLPVLASARNSCLA